MDWKTYAWLKRGKRRIDVLRLFHESRKPMSATDIKKKCKIAISQASYTLKELLEMDLIICLNPNDNIGKLFEITKEGDELINEI